MAGIHRGKLALMQMSRDATACDLAEDEEKLLFGMGKVVRRLQTKGYASRIRLVGGAHFCGFGGGRFHLSAPLE